MQKPCHRKRRGWQTYRTLDVPVGGQPPMERPRRLRLAVALGGVVAPGGRRALLGRGGRGAARRHSRRGSRLVVVGAVRYALPGHISVRSAVVRPATRSLPATRRPSAPLLFINRRRLRAATPGDATAHTAPTLRSMLPHGVVKFLLQQCSTHFCFIYYFNMYTIKDGRSI